MSHDWKSCFPYPEPRADQPEVIEKILQSFLDGDKRFAIIEAPTGAGKSAIGYTIGRYFESYWYVTAQKILQSQLSGDFGEDGTWSGDNPMIELKGRNAYPCDYYEIAPKDPEVFLTDDQVRRYAKNVKEGVDCATGECKRKGKSKLAYCAKNNVCPYFKQVDKAVASPAVLMNFHSFIFQTEFVPDRWDTKKLLIIDEAHNTEQVLMDYVSFTITDIADWVPNLPKFSTAEEYLIFFEEVDILGTLKSKLEEAMDQGDSDKEEEWVKQIGKYQMFRESVQKHEWIPQYDEKTLAKTSSNKAKKYRVVELKPLFVKDFAEDLLFSKAEKVLMMSATILSVDIMCDALGIDRSEVYAKRIGSDFPVENRPIYYKGCGNMSFKEINKTLPKMAKEVEKLCKLHEDDRGIIHTHTFRIAEFIKENASPELKARLFLQTDYESKDQMLAVHAKSDNGIIIAPAMHEGLDLKDDLSRFQIICKVPYPGLGNNPQLKRRMDLSSDYYQYLAALKLVQQYGRSIRSKDDSADTYVLDSGFRGYFERSKAMLPKWFVEAIIWK